MPKFHFVVPLMCSDVAVGKRGKGHWLKADNPDGPSVEATLERCLKSILNQSDPDFVIHLCCHDLPPLHVDDPRLVVDEVDSARPADMGIGAVRLMSDKYFKTMPSAGSRKLLAVDKRRKVLWGLCEAFLDPGCQWVMVVDADDLIHREIVEYADSHRLDMKSAGGIVVTSGYCWCFDEDDISDMGGFFRTCGTSNVVRVVESEREIYLKAVSWPSAFGGKNHWSFAGHADLHKRIKAAGRQMSKFPFRAAIYTVMTHHSMYNAGRFRDHHWYPLTDEIRKNFGMHL